MRPQPSSRQEFEDISQCGKARWTDTCRGQPNARMRSHSNEQCRHEIRPLLAWLVRGHHVRRRQADRLHEGNAKSDCIADTPQDEGPPRSMEAPACRTCETAHKGGARSVRPRGDKSRALPTLWIRDPRWRDRPMHQSGVRLRLLPHRARRGGQAGTMAMPDEGPTRVREEERFRCW